MRALTVQEIEQLECQRCTAESWENVRVHEAFNAAHVRHTAFRGDVEIGEDVRLDHVGVIENYVIGNHVIICRVNELVTDEWIELLLEKEGLTVGNEAGDPNIRFSFSPNEKRDWIEMHLAPSNSPRGGESLSLNIPRSLSLTLSGDPSLNIPGSPSLNIPNREGTENAKVSLSLPQSGEVWRGSRAGLIADNCLIKNCGTIRNVNIDKDVRLEGAAHLETGLLHEGSYIGTQVIARTFVIGPRTKVTDGAKLYHVITTHDCKIGKGFMAENCYFGHHSELFCGEACAIFAGPHTVSHHKSTLLIGGEFSFYNAGSNTNQSNHAYKLGPIHHGTLARGSKTASGCHILWPMQTAPFTMVMGKVKTHPDLSALPFSYIFADGEKVFVAPGVNLGTAGTFRDVLKWKERGSSPYVGEYDFLSPWVMQSVFKGMEALKGLQEKYGEEVEEYPYNNTFIKRSALLKGLSRYQLAIRLFAGEITPVKTVDEASLGWHWIDAAGLPLVEEFLKESHEQLNSPTPTSINQEYIHQKQLWGAAMLARHYGGEFTSGKMYEEAKVAFEEWKQLVIADARKEYALGDMETDLLAAFIEKVTRQGADFL